MVYSMNMPLELCNMALTFLPGKVCSPLAVGGWAQCGGGRTCYSLGTGFSVAMWGRRRRAPGHFRSL